MQPIPCRRDARRRFKTTQRRPRIIKEALIESERERGDVVGIPTADAEDGHDGSRHQVTWIIPVSACRSVQCCVVDGSEWSGSDQGISGWVDIEVFCHDALKTRRYSCEERIGIHVTNTAIMDNESAAIGYP